MLNHFNCNFAIWFKATWFKATRFKATWFKSRRNIIVAQIIFDCINFSHFWILWDVWTNSQYKRLDVANRNINWDLIHSSLKFTHFYASQPIWPYQITYNISISMYFPHLHIRFMKVKLLWFDYFSVYDH